MGLWDRITGEFIDVVEWTDDSNDTMVYRFERRGNEIKFGAKLTVRESQVAVFINEGQLADVFPPGMYTLETRNLPVLSTLQGWKYGFQSPFKAEVYFVSTRRFTDLKWGTKNPIMLRDAEFGAVRLRAFGTYSIRVSDAPTFIREVVGTDGRFTTDEITDQLRNLIVARFSTIIGESKIPVLDLAASYDNLGKFITERIAPEFKAYGLEVQQLTVENISLPPAVEEALDRRTSMGVVGDLGRYTQYQIAESIPAAAANPGGLAGAGAGMGLGLAIGQQAAQALGQQPQQPQPQPHPQPWGPAPAAAAPPPAAAPAPPPGPPPLPQALQVYVALGGQQAGPFGMPELQRHVQAGQLARGTLVWMQGMANWTAAGEVPALAGLFAAVPPPLPPR